MNQEYKLYRISQLLSRFKEQVTILNANGEFSINIHSENILIRLLNEIFSCNLKNVNYEEGKTYPSIDLRDKTNRIAIQVTSTANFEKIKHTLNQYLENELYNEFDTLYIFILTQKQSKYDQSKIDKIINGKFNFDVKKIIDKTDIYKELNSQNNLNKIEKIASLLEEQFADNKPEMDKWDLYCKGLHDYDQFISNIYTFLDIKGFSPKINNTLVKLNLEDIYVPLELKLETEFEPPQDELKRGSSKTFSIEYALNNFNNIAILGDPGSGKSTVLKYLARKVCQNRSTTHLYSDLVPIIIKGSEFAKYVQTTSKQLAEYIIDHIEKKYELLFTKKLETDQLLVLVDGIDEINIANIRHDVVNRINAFIAHYPNIKIIVSSRLVGYKETRLNGFFNHLKVLEFGEEQIKNFVKNWYLSIAYNSDKDEQSALNKATELYKAIEENPSVLKMASNPLLATIIALIYYQGNSLPEKRATLYDIATSTFLENWVKQRESKNLAKFDKDSLVEILAPISFYIHQNYSTGLISESELKIKLAEELKRINPYLNLKEEKQDIKDIIEFLREDAGFLFEKGYGENGEPFFGFVHQTFQEYFTSIEFKTRWKESAFKENLDDYAFSSNWIEVIKLAASLFKANEPSRLGRRYTTDFVKNMLQVKDSYPEVYRPLALVLNILSEDTEIEFSLFIEIIDKVFFEILNNEEQSHRDPYENNREVARFKYLLEGLIDSRFYQSYVVERIIKQVKEEDCPEPLRYNLMDTLISKSDVSMVKEELSKVLISNNHKLKELLFNYKVVMPVAPIVFTDEFRNSIVSYINSEGFIAGYNGHLPTQYHCSFERLKKGNLDLMFDQTDIEETYMDMKEEMLLSIRLIENQSIKRDYIDYLVFSIGMSHVNELNTYISDLTKEYPDLTFPKIKKYIKELELFNSYQLEEYESIAFKSIKIYLKKNEALVFGFVKGKNVQYLKYPFKKSDLRKYFKEDADSFSIFLNYIVPVLTKEESELVINNQEMFENFMKYQKTIHWSSFVNINSVLNYALSVLFNEANKFVNSILNWIKNQDMIRFRRFEIIDTFNKQEFISRTLASELELYDKLFLLNLVGEKVDYQHLLRPAIESLKTEKSEEKKKQMKRVLYQVL